MRRKKPINPIMLVFVTVALLLLGMLIKGLTGVFRSKEDKEAILLAEAFDKAIDEKTGLFFAEKEIISIKEIHDYEMYVNPRYLHLFKVNQMLFDMERFRTLEPKEMAVEVKKQEEKVNKMEQEGQQDDLEVETEKLAWMIAYKKEQNIQVRSAMEHRRTAIADSMYVMEKKSPGFQYIIDTSYKDSLFCRFVMVAPKDDPYNLKIGGGRLLTKEEKEREKEEKQAHHPLSKMPQF